MLPFNAENTEVQKLCKEEILIIVPDSILKEYCSSSYQNIKSQLKKGIDISLLKDCPFLMVNARNRVRIIADEMFKEKNIEPNILLETENIETVLALSIKGMGITFYPRTLMHNKDLTFVRDMFKGINIYNLEYKKTHGTLAIGYRKDRYLSMAAKEFIEIAKEKYNL